MTDGPIVASQVPAEAPDSETTEALTREERVAALREFPLGQTVRVPLDLIAPAERNPRRGRVGEVIESLREFGQHRPVVVQLRRAEAIVGNHLWRAAKKLGWSEIDAFIVDDDDRMALRRAVADNATGDAAGWDDEELAEVMQEIGAVPGFDDGDIRKLLKRLETADELADPTHPLMPQLNERYEMVLVLATNETDFAWLATKLDLRSERSYKSTAVQRAHVVTVERLQTLWGT
jgi:hypothetical protein